MATDPPLPSSVRPPWPLEAMESAVKEVPCPDRGTCQLSVPCRPSDKAPQARRGPSGREPVSRETSAGNLGARLPPRERLAPAPSYLAKLMQENGGFLQ